MNSNSEQLVLSGEEYASFSLAIGSVLQGGEFKDIARVIFDQSCKITGATSGYVALLNEVGDENEVLFLEAGGLPCTVDPGLPMPIRGLRAESYSTGKVVYDNDFMNSEWVKFMPAGHVVLKNVLFAPLCIGGKTVGIMGLANKDTDFSPRDASIAGVLGEMSAIALGNWRAQVQQKEMYFQLLQAQKLESIGRLAAGVAHEINTPTQFLGDNLTFLNDAIGEITHLLDKLKTLFSTPAGVSLESHLTELKSAWEALDVDFFTSEFPSAMTDSLAGVTRITQIVQALQEFSNPGADIKQPLSLNATITSTVAVTRGNQKSAAVIETDLDVNLPSIPCIKGDMHQVLLNLIVNARDAVEARFGEYSQEKGRVVISSAIDGKWIVVKVTDNGCGIEGKIQSIVFDPFFTTKEEGKGTGQGLAIARSIVVQKHRGELFFESVPGEGTVFTMRLPLDV